MSSSLNEKTVPWEHVANSQKQELEFVNILSGWKSLDLTGQTSFQWPNYSIAGIYATNFNNLDLRNVELLILATGLLLCQLEPCNQPRYSSEKYFKLPLFLLVKVAAVKSTITRSFLLAPQKCIDSFAIRSCSHKNVTIHWFLLLVPSKL